MCVNLKYIYNARKLDEKFNSNYLLIFIFQDLVNKITPNRRHILFGNT